MKAANAGVARRHGMRVGCGHAAKPVTVVVALVVVLVVATGVARH
jgi:hypothetical protein